MVYSIPWYASSFGGGTQQARSAANMSRIEFEGMIARSCEFAMLRLRSFLISRDDCQPQILSYRRQIIRKARFVAENAAARVIGAER